MEFIQLFIAALKRSIHRYIAIHPITFVVFERRYARPTCDLHILKAMEGETWRPVFLSATFQYVAILLPGRLWCAGSTPDATFLYLCSGSCHDIDRSIFKNIFSISQRD